MQNDQKSLVSDVGDDTQKASPKLQTKRANQDPDVIDLTHWGETDYDLVSGSDLASRGRPFPLEYATSITGLDSIPNHSTNEGGLLREFYPQRSN